MVRQRFKGALRPHLGAVFALDRPQWLSPATCEKVDRAADPEVGAGVAPYPSELIGVGARNPFIETEKFVDAWDQLAVSGKRALNGDQCYPALLEPAMVNLRVGPQ